MDSGYYAACSALVSRTEALDTIANNLANTSTVGYRAQHNVFSSVLASTQSSSSLEGLNQAMNDYSLLSGTRLDLSQGTLMHTGNDLDLAIQGPGFFAVQTPAGVRYTRGGSLQVSSKGELQDANGNSVLGENGPIKVLGGKLSISPDGTISSNGAIAGRLKLVEFTPGTNLASEGDSYYSAPQGSDVASTQSQVSQGSLENSNVNAVTTMVELINAQRSADSMQRALSMFSSEMDKTAVQDLPHVG